VSKTAPAWDVDSPVQAEIFVVWLDGERLALTGPCGPGPWILELGREEHPMDVVHRIVRDVLGDPLLVHSTSWRRDRDAVILSFVVVIDAAAVTGMASLPVRRAELARGGASEAPTAIGFEQVLDHGLRHLAWLMRDDPVVRDTLSHGWRIALADYVPEPFRSFA
jgi:hypothetical protein